MKDLKVGSICIVTGGMNFEKDSVVILTNLEQDGTNAEDYEDVSGLEEYFRDVSFPTQQEIDMFNMLYGTELTREDLCQGQ